MSTHFNIFDEPQKPDWKV